MSPTAPRRLVIMRHAKAESSARSDHARELTDRGRRQSRAAGSRLASKGVLPDFVVVSSAARATSTASEVLAGLELPSEPETRVLDSLYQADPYDLLSVCALEIEQQITTALVIGHNPTIAGAAHLTQPEEARVDLAFPTAAFAVFEAGGSLERTSGRESVSSWTRTLRTAEGTCRSRSGAPAGRGVAMPCAASSASRSSRLMPSRYRIESRYGTLTAVSAASRTRGLALKAMPSPAVASMSRSLAPSPMATVRSSVTLESAAKSRRAAALPARSTTGPTMAAGEPAVGDLEYIGPGVVDAEVGREPIGEMGEPAAHDARSGSRAAGASGRRYARPAPARSRRTPPGSTSASSPRRSATRRRSEVSKSSSPRIADSVIAATSSPTPACGRQGVDHLALDEGRVDVHHDQPAPVPQQPGRSAPRRRRAARRPPGRSTARSWSRSAPETSNSIAVTG